MNATEEIPITNVGGFFPLTLKTPAELKYHIEHNLVSVADWGRGQQRKKAGDLGVEENYIKLYIYKNIS